MYGKLRKLGTTKKKYVEVIRKDMEAKSVNEVILFNTNEWTRMIHVLDSA